ncbi:hypothetical protein ACIPID_17985 [Cupriavidus sp. CER94]|uniref:hypothetical protein n=1 Tax=Cupriavidus sp. CER94 TaxID=3377036 RepID=UPI0037F83CB7
MRNKLAQQGAEAMTLAPDAFGKFVVAEYQPGSPSWSAPGHASTDRRGAVS